MKNKNFYITELKKEFSNRKYFLKSELRNLYKGLFNDFNENIFRRILYYLENEKIIISVDRGTYILNNQQIHQPRKQFVPIFSPKFETIINSIQSTFPYTKILFWETRILHNFMIHQPSQNLIIIESEKDAMESIFNSLKNQSIDNVFLNPKNNIIDHYILQNSESIIISPLISRSPYLRMNNIYYPKLEKILVDIFAEDEKFIIFQGQELINIYTNAFHSHKISETTLFYYAQRRKVKNKIKIFINQKTDIQLIQFGDTNYDFK